MSRISSVEEELNTEIIRSQVEIADGISNLLKNLNVPNADIIRLTLTDYLKLPRDFVEIAAMAAEAADAAGIGKEDGMGIGGGGGMGGMGGGDMGDEEMGGLGESPPYPGSEGPTPESGTQGAFGKDDFDIPEPREESHKEKSMLMERAGFKGRALRPSGTVSRSRINESRIALTKSVSKLGSLNKVKRISLVEDYRGDDGLDHQLRESLTRSARGNVGMEYATSSLLESALTHAEASVPESTLHESVRQVRNIRRKQRK